jgi:hypothetical protein
MTFSAVYSASSSQAFKNAKKNNMRRYPAPGDREKRLYPLVTPSSRGTFKISKTDSIFAIGSCFARNIEGALHQAGMNVLSRKIDLGKIGDEVGSAATFFNKYTVVSILNDLEWALERDTFPGEDIIYSISKEIYCDPQLGLVKLPYPLPEIMDMRTRYLDAMAQVVKADVVIITLGYVETWYDKELDLYLNIAPPPRLCTQFPDRFEFRVLGFEDVLKALEKIYALLKKHRKTPLKMLLTVSPVPLLSTFRDMDVLVANTYSKSVQRAAVETFVATKLDVDYFPSYESVTLSNPEVCWARGDYRHVSPDIVARIMSYVLVNYVPRFDAPGIYQGTPMTLAATFATARLLIKLKAGNELVELFIKNRGLFAEDEPLLSLIADTLQKTDHPKVAARALEDIVALSPQKPLMIQRLITLAARDPENKAKVHALLVQHTERFPNRVDFRKRVEKSLA